MTAKKRTPMAVHPVDGRVTDSDRKATPVEAVTRSPGIPSELRSLIWAAIAAHILVHGRHHWNLVRERPEFAPLVGKQAGETGRRRFWRWVKCVTKPTPKDSTRPHEAREIASEALNSATDRARLAAQSNLPAAPSPAYLMRGGADAARSIDFLVEFHEIYDDAKRLREHAIQRDEYAPGGWRIEDPKLFDAAMKRRLQILETQLRCVQEVWSLERQQRFYQGISDLIAGELAAVPEIQKRVIRKLADLNKAQGMTIHAATV